MTVQAEEKQKTISQFAMRDGDTGSARVQVALITTRLNNLQEHFKTHAKDYHSRRGLMKLVGQRRRLLDYIRSRDIQQYRELIQELGIRK